MKFWEQIARLLPEEEALADRAASRPMERTLFARCVTDLSDGYTDVSAGTGKGRWYRRIPSDLDGKPGPASAARQLQN